VIACLLFLVSATVAHAAADTDNPSIVISSVVAAPGQRVPFRVVLSLRGHTVIFFENEVSFALPLSIARRPSGYPDCFLIPGEVIFYEFGFGLKPFGCTAPGECSSLGFSGLPLQDRPPDASPLYGCYLDIDQSAPAGDHELGCVRQRIGEPVPPRYVDLDCTPGSIRVVRCTGDCEGTGSVAIGDVLTGVAIALGENELSACYPMDQDADGAVTVSELIAAVNHVLTGCPE
jgi:hypothetical protein